MLGHLFCDSIYFVLPCIMFVDSLMAFLQHLYKSFQEEPSFFQFATAITSDDLEEIQKFLDDAVNSRLVLLIWTHGM